MLFCACLDCVCVCVAAVPWNLKSGYAPLLQTQWLFVPSITPRECHTGGPLVLLIYRFKSQTCRGCPPPLGWGHARNQKMYGWVGPQEDIWIELVTHFTFFLLLLQIVDHIYISVSLMRKKIAASEGESKSLWHILFLSKSKAKLFIICLDMTGVILRTLFRDSDIYCWPCK